jgi:ABC-type transporter Mla maintaining outer membrane lipid asymmetry permease subunit MlaE
VKGGAEGVGKATTMTVVYSIVSIIVAACIFTMVFYVFKL